MEYPWTAKEWARESRPSLDLVPTSNLRGGVKPVLVGWEGPRSKSLRRGGVKMKGTPAGGKKKLNRKPYFKSFPALRTTSCILKT